MTARTIKALADITDEGLFERVATAVLREGHPLCAGLTHQGTNADGMTVKAPIDNVSFVLGADPPHHVSVQHTITAVKSLEKKWLFDPEAPPKRRKPAKPGSTKPASRGRNRKKPKGPPGDLVKTAEIVAKERQRTPSMLSTLILTTNEEPNEELVRDVTAAGAAQGIGVDIWSRARIAHVLDNTPNGQWIRRQLGIEADLLCGALLKELSRRSLDSIKPADDRRAWVSRSLDGVLSRLRRPTTFVVAESGQGKSVACYRALQSHLEGGGVGLVLPHEILEQSSTLETALSESLCRLHPRLAPGQSAIGLAMPERPLLVIVEDINASGHAQRLVEKLVSWTSSAESPAALRLLCPVWPRVLGVLNEQTRKAIEPMLLFPELMTVGECRNAVVVRAELAGRTISVVTAEELAARLGCDPLLIALHDYDAESDPHDVIGGFVERSLVRAQEHGPSHAHTLRGTLLEVAEHMLRRRRLDPGFAELQNWGLSDRQLQDISQVAKAEHLLRMVGPPGSPRMVFRHDRVRDWLLVERAGELNAQGQLTDDIVGEPFYAEILGDVLDRCDAPPGLVERVKNLNPLALFRALRLVRMDQARRAMLRSAIQQWLVKPSSRGIGKSHLRWDALAALETTDGQDVPDLVRQFPDKSPVGYLAALHNGSVEAAVRICAMFEFGMGAAFRDRQLEHAKLHFGERFLTEVSEWLQKLNEGDEAARRGLLELAGHLAEPILAPAIEACLRNDPAPERHHRQYFWAFARCCAEDVSAQRNLAPVCDAWALLSDRRETTGLPSPRDNFAAYGLHPAFRREPPTQAALRYLISRAGSADLSWQLTYMLNGIDDPLAVQHVVDYSAKRARESPDGSTFAAGKFADDWRDRKTFEPGYMTPRSRAPLYDQWSDTKNDRALRRVAFRLWAATEGSDDLSLLQRSQGDDLLGESILSTCLMRGDTSAVPALVERLQRGEADWWPLACSVWAPVFLVELERTLAARRQRSTGTWIELSNEDYYLTEVIVRLTVPQAEQILLRHWEHVRFSSRFVQLAFYFATPELVRRANECVVECPEPAKLLEHISSTYGVRQAGHPGVTRELQILVLAPYTQFFAEGDRTQLADACNEGGWYETRRRLFDKDLTNSFYAWHVDDASKAFDELLARKHPVIRYEIERALRTGVSWAEFFRALCVWLTKQTSINALTMVVEAVIEQGSRDDVDAIRFAGHADAVTIASLLEDAAYAVRRRSLR